MDQSSFGFELTPIQPSVPASRSVTDNGLHWINVRRCNIVRKSEGFLADRLHLAVRIAGMEK
jgi:hypothetical protein